MSAVSTSLPRMFCFSNPSHLLTQVIEGESARGNICKFTVRETLRDKPKFIFAGILEYGGRKSTVCILKEDPTGRESNAFARLVGIPNIVKPIVGFANRNSVFLAIEKLDSPNLTRRIIAQGPFSFQKTCQIARDMLPVLLKLKEKGLIYGDIKLENIGLTEDGTAKLFDVEGLTDVRENVQWPHVCTLGTLSPEVLWNISLTPSYDMWCLGIVLYECVTGSPFSIATQGLPTSEVTQKIPAEATQHIAAKLNNVYQYLTLLGPVPEFIRSKPGYKDFIEQLTLLGLSLNTIGSKDFDPLTFKEIDDNLRQAVIRTNEDPNQAKMLRKLLSEIFTYDFEKRISPEDASKHPFITHGMTPASTLGPASTTERKEEKKR
jgi:serine/threonine protein kinase